jgi:hypothetical protein
VLAPGHPGGRPRLDAHALNSISHALRGYVGSASPERPEGKGWHLRFRRTWAPRRVVADAGRRTHETIQHKARKRDATPDLLLKHQNTIVATYV